jgi:hypothetical protein
VQPPPKRSPRTQRFWRANARDARRRLGGSGVGECALGSAEAARRERLRLAQAGLGQPRRERLGRELRADAEILHDRCIRTDCEHPGREAREHRFDVRVAVGARAALAFVTRAEHTTHVGEAAVERRCGALVTARQVAFARGRSRPGGTGGEQRAQQQARRHAERPARCCDDPTVLHDSPPW